MKKIKFPQMPTRQFIENYGFMSQWCCKCGNRHIWHFRIHRRGKTGDNDFIEINGFQDDKGTKLRKFYNKQGLQITHYQKSGKEMKNFAQVRERGEYETGNSKKYFKFYDF